jgi:MFS family permease
MPHLSATRRHTNREAGSINNRGSDFIRLLSAQATSQVGSQITALALPLTAIKTLKAPALEVSLLAVTSGASMLLVALPAGALIDRRPGRSLLVVANVARAIALLSIPISAVSGTLTIFQLYAAAIAFSGLTTLFDLGFQSFLLAVVPSPEQLSSANAKFQATRSFGFIVGPALGGLLIGTITPPGAIVADAISFLVSATLLLGVSAHSRAFVPSGADGRPNVLSGTRFVATNPILCSLLLGGALFSFFNSMLLAVFFLYAVRWLSLPAATIGLTLAIGNLGPLFGALVAARWIARLGFGRGMVIAAALWTAGLAIPLAPAGIAGIPLLVLAFLIGGFGTLVVNVGSLTARQALPPRRMVGRVASVIVTAIAGAMPLGGLCGGLIASTAGVPVAVWTSVIGLSLAAIPLVRLWRIAQILPGSALP